MELKISNNIISDEKLVKNIIDEIDDVSEHTSVAYEIWAVGCDETGASLQGVEVFIAKYSDSSQAVEEADKLTLADIVEASTIDCAEETDNSNICYIAVEVETVVEDGDGNAINIGTIYKRHIALVEELDDDPIIALTTSDYNVLHDGTLVVSCKILDGFNKNDYVLFQFIDEKNTSPLTYKIVSKAIYSNGDYYHCEFIY